MNRRLAILVATVLGRGGSGVIPDTILYRDTFSVDEGAPMASPHAADVLGSMTLTDTATGADMSVSGGEWLRPRPTGNLGYGNYGGATVTSFPRAAGLLFSSRQKSTVIAGFGFGMNSASNLGGVGDNGAIYAFSAAQLVFSPGAGATPVVGGITSAVYYLLGVMARSAGAHFLIKGGTEYLSWTRLYVSIQNNAATLYMCNADHNSDVTVDYLDVRQKNQGHWLEDFGGCTYYDATPTANDEADGTADALMYLTWTVGADETMSMYFRWNGTTGYRLDCNDTDNTIKLFRVDGGDTELNAGKTQTWTPGTQYRVGITCAGGNIWTFVEVPAGVTAKHVVTGESLNLTETGAKVAGFAAAANWEIWPRTLSGTDETDVL